MPPREDIEQRAWRALVRTHARVNRALDRELSERAGISLRAYQVLDRLSRAEDGAMRMAELANSVLLSASGMTRLVDQLAARGLVQRHQDAADARGSLAALTDKGRAQYRKAATAYRRSVKEHLAARLEATQLRELAVVLEGFLGDQPVGGRGPWR
jgi:DNA-binding MarR family transcriptional regulator